jgi:hypothetical protein
MPDSLSVSRLVPHGLSLCQPHPPMGTGEPLMTAVYQSATELAAALKPAADAHHQYEQSTGKPDADWYHRDAEHMAKEQQPAPAKAIVARIEEPYDTRPLMD